MAYRLMQVLFSVFKAALMIILLAGGLTGCNTASPVIPPRPENTYSQLSHNRFMILCYHEIPTRNTSSIYAVNIFTLIKEIEYMRDHGYHFVGLKDVLTAREGGNPLPENAVMLTFDDAYEDFYMNAFPILKLYKIPAMLAVVTSWIDKPEEAKKYGKLMTWKQIKEVSDSGLISIASHSANSHKAVVINPQGGTGPAIYCKIYDPKSGTYETEAEYRKRLFMDFSQSREEIARHTGKAPAAIVWPYGAYTGIALEEAKKAGFILNFTLDDGAAQVDMETLPRHMLTQNVGIAEFARSFKMNFLPKYPSHKKSDQAEFDEDDFDEKPSGHGYRYFAGGGESLNDNANSDSGWVCLSDRVTPMKAVQVDLDLVYDPDVNIQNRNIDKVIERIYNIMPSTVFLQAFSDDKANGNIGSVYFPNRVLPMKADLFCRVARSISIRGIQVYAWMPTLAIKLPDEKENSKLRIREFKNNKIQFSHSWYTNRLSPFSPEAVKKLETLYEDMAANAPVAGVIFQDDGYLNDFEDYSNAGREAFLKISGGKLVPFKDLTPEQKDKWTDLKTDTLIDLTEKLKKKVRYYRPTALFARTIYAPVLTKPFSEEWFAQNYEKCLKNYDFTVVMSYPEMEQIKYSDKWFRKLVQAAGKYPDGIKKTVFKVQTYNWKKKKWLPSREVAGWLRTLIEAGAWNIAYYPDDYTVNEPKLKVISRVISVRDFPERKDWKENGLHP